MLFQKWEHAQNDKSKKKFKKLFCVNNLKSFQYYLIYLYFFEEVDYNLLIMMPWKLMQFMCVNLHVIFYGVFSMILTIYEIFIFILWYLSGYSTNSNLTIYLCYYRKMA